MSTTTSKRVLILGATGPSGLLTVRKALEHDQVVTIYARNPSKIPTDVSTNVNLKTTIGDLTDTAKLSEAIKGQDAIISLLGPVGTSHTGTPLTDAYRSIFKLMNEHGVKRILAMGTGSISDPEDGSSILLTLAVGFVKWFVAGAYKEIISIGKLFESEGTDAGLDWTIFRLGLLKDGPPQTPKAGYIGKDGWGLNIQRADIATWLVDEVEKDDSTWIRKRPALWS